MEIRKLKYKIIVKTGLRIGGLAEAKIGGLDNPVIRTKLGYKESYVEFPIIPGSSVKGKLRYLLKNFGGINEVEIKKYFGTGASDDSDINYKYVKLLFRDLYPKLVYDVIFGNNKIDDVRSFQEAINSLTEIKPENRIDIKENKLQANPRFNERIVPGTEFIGEIIIFLKESEDKLSEVIDLLNKGFDLLCMNYLGGSGSRGYGKVDVKFYCDNEWKEELDADCFEKLNGDAK